MSEARMTGDWYTAIEALLSRRDVKKAELQISKGLRQELDDDQRADLLAQRVRVRLMAGRPDEAIQTLAAISQLKNELMQTPHLLELVGDAHLARYEQATVGFTDRADLVHAQEAYQQIMDEHPHYSNLGWVLYQMGRVALITDAVSKANDYFRRALFSACRFAGLTAYCFERLGFIAYYETRSSRDALIFLDKAVDTYPAQEPRLWLVQVHLLRSRVLRESNLDEAVHAARYALTLAETSASENRSTVAETLMTLAELLASLPGRSRELVDYLQQFMQMSKMPLGVDVTWSRAYEMLGDAKFSLADYTAASEAYAAALQCNPDHPWADTLHFRIARCQYHLHEYEQTIQTTQRLLNEHEQDRHNTETFRLQNLLGNAYFARKQYALAEQAYASALKAAPPGAEVDEIRSYHQLSHELNQPL